MSFFAYNQDQREYDIPSYLKKIDKAYSDIELAYTSYNQRLNFQRYRFNFSKHVVKKGLFIST